jgi:3-oxoadipate enol-lactonase
MTEKQFTTSDGISLRYTDQGPAGGDTVILVHGLAAAGRQFEADAAFFADQGFRVLVPDLRGHGRSGAPEPQEHDRFSIVRLGTDVEELLAQTAPGPVHWVGNSLGGIIALPLLRRKPGLFRTFATFGTAFRLDLPRLTPFLLPLPHRLFGRRLAGWGTARMTTQKRAAWPVISAIIEDFDPLVGQAVARHVHRYDLRAEADSFTGPMLMLRGGRDRAVNLALGESLAVVAGKANFTLVDLKEGGHCANLDATEAWRTALLTFWADAVALRPQPGAASA